MKLLRLQIGIGIASLAAAGPSGCSSGSNPTAAPPTNPVAGSSVYVLQTPTANSLSGTAYLPSTILQFSADSSGSVSPESTITATAPLVALASDQAGNIYTSTGFYPGQDLFTNTCQEPNPASVGSILEFPAGASGAAAPIREISGSDTRLCYTSSLAVSPTGQIVAGQGFEVDEWSATQTGNVAPERFIISGALDEYGFRDEISVDSANNLYVANPAIGPRNTALLAGPTLWVYGPDLTGPDFPSSRLPQPEAAGGLAIDGSNNIYETSAVCPGGHGPCSAEIAEYADPDNHRKCYAAAVSPRHQGGFRGKHLCGLGQRCGDKPEPNRA